ncbi:hypothetical protein [Novimethylophilus kurashikiensis]|nr:hypothetical protein [Novimethylophilus kurashikiensis]
MAERASRFWQLDGVISAARVCVQGESAQGDCADDQLGNQRFS